MIIITVILDGMKSVNGFIGAGSVTLTCEARGYTNITNPTIIWSATDGKSLDDSSKYIISETSGSNELISFNGNSTRSSVVSSLEIRALSPDDQGRYTCMVDNIQTLPIELTVLSGTAPPTTPTPTDLTTGSLDEPTGTQVSPSEGI